MGLKTKQNTFTKGATIVASEHNQNYNDIYDEFNGNIDNDNIKASAGIVDTKLAQITTTGKVSGASITLMTSLPSGAGVLPIANLYTATEVIFSTTTGVDMKTATETALYATVPTGKSAVVTKVVIRNISETLAGGTDYQFGTMDARNEWKSASDLSALTNTSTGMMTVTNFNEPQVVFPSGTNFGIEVITGSTAASTATVDVLGYLV